MQEPGLIRGELRKLLAAIRAAVGGRHFLVSHRDRHVETILLNRTGIAPLLYGDCDG
ncbi:MAG: hypothetical protein ACLVJN_10690 [Streptococcus parasanguinis]